MDLISTLLLVLLPVVVSYLSLNYLSPKRDYREPPLIQDNVPFIGHILGLIRYGIQYYARTSAKHPFPAFTLNLLYTKTYVINSASLVSAVQRSSKIISFDPFLTGAAHRMAGISGSGLKLLEETESGGGGINNKVLHSMHPALLGPGLDKMNETMIKNLKVSIDELEFKEGITFDLHAWCRHAITVASTDAVYGPQNPYKSKEVEDALWDFESNLNTLLINVLPRFTARKAFKARQKINDSFVKYYEKDGHLQSSEMAMGRWKAQHDAGATTRDIARLETAAGIGILSNTVPSTFWTIFEIYSRPQLLEKLRAEILDAMRADTSTVDSQSLHIIDLANIRDACPLLVSSFQEVLRLRSNGAPTRVVYKDHMLGDRYLLKAGAVLQMPAHSINREDSTWGADAEDFNPSRFISNGERKDQKRVTGYMSFGASPNMCPGRHFASGEVLAMAAMLMLRYDIKPASGEWTRPRLNTRAMAASITPPVEEFMVQISPRKEVEGVEWAFKVTEGKGKFSLITG
ncbi:MAG: hypothetical protein M1835_001006 [Candelina submexicana]|nr:MAG: hypothetical protein M1835_001006 [Candelina submexicana]